MMNFLSNKNQLMKKIKQVINEENRLKVNNELNKESSVITVTLDHVEYINLLFYVNFEQVLSYWCLI